MKPKKGFSSLSVQLTATISVALVLLLLGLVATIGIAAHAVTDNIKEQLGFDVTLDESATLDDVNSYKRMFGEAAYVSSYAYHSPEEALAQWNDETGENLIEMLGVNPFYPEFEVNVKAEYASPDSLDAIMLPLAEMPHVFEVTGFENVAEAVNRNTHTLMFVLVLILCALLPISLVLINNTVRLAIFARRFTIHTMKLVGASRGFIRRPFLLSNALQGVIAAVIASGLLFGVYAYLGSVIPSVRPVLTHATLAVVCAGLLCVGPLLCLVAAAWATQRYLSSSYDDLF